MIKLKIGKVEYSITSRDIFMDDGTVVQLTSQRLIGVGSFTSPVLSKRAVKKISKFKRIQLPHSYRASVQVFNLDIPNNH